MKQGFFAEERERALAEARSLEQLDGRLSLARSLVFVLAVLACAGGYDGLKPLWVVGGALFAVFAVLIRRHGSLRRRAQLLQGRLSAVDWYLARWQGEWQREQPDGSEFLGDSPQAVDLHLLGRGSCFQYLCCARTRAGREGLAAALSPLPPERRVILARQQAVRELTERPELCLEFLAKARQLPAGDDLRPLLQGLAGEPAELAAVARLAASLRFLLPGALLLTAALSAVGLLPWLLPGLVVLLAFSLSLLALPSHQAALAPLAPLEHALHAYEEVFRLAEGEIFASAHLQGLAATLREGKAAEGLQALAAQVDAMLSRRNFLVFLLGDALLLWDSHLAAHFLAWRHRFGGKLAAWLGAWAELEVLLSLAAVALTRERYVFPEIAEEAAPLLQGEGIVSLLLPEAKAVPNGADFCGESCIITGSNMSGKTTYLRTLAGAAVLAYAGAPVCGDSLRISPMQIFTSIQVTDDLAGGISTFYAELLRVRQMVEAAERGEPMLVCIDEIFKGTNSADRILGAKAAIERLTRPHILALVTTHDFELCKLRGAEGEPLRNFHFEEHYADDKIEFDFRIKTGPCRTTNARYLLRMAGILK